MPSHPNRSKREPSAARNPTPTEIRSARERAGLTQRAAAELIYCTPGAWQQWELGQRRMHPAYWRLFGILAAAYGEQPVRERVACLTSAMNEPFVGAIHGNGGISDGLSMPRIELEGMFSREQLGLLYSFVNRWEEGHYGP